MTERSEPEFSIEIQSAPLPVGEAIAALHAPEAGAIDVFVGTTRRWTEGRETTVLTYECYEPMARRELARLADEAARRWPIVRGVLLHRTGVVPVGEASVVVGVATPHRADAFAACRFLIDRLKVDVPIWKQERYADGTREWVEGDPSADR